jgi:hypothetical protein
MEDEIINNLKRQRSVDRLSDYFDPTKHQQHHPHYAKKDAENLIKLIDDPTGSLGDRTWVERLGTSAQGQAFLNNVVMPHFEGRTVGVNLTDQQVSDHKRKWARNILGSLEKTAQANYDLYEKDRVTYLTKFNKSVKAQFDAYQNRSNNYKMLREKYGDQHEKTLDAQDQAEKAKRDYHNQLIKYQMPHNKDVHGDPLTGEHPTFFHPNDHEYDYDPNQMVTMTEKELHMFGMEDQSLIDIFNLAYSNHPREAMHGNVNAYMKLMEDGSDKEAKLKAQGIGIVHDMYRDGASPEIIEQFIAYSDLSLGKMMEGDIPEIKESDIPDKYLAVKKANEIIQNFEGVTLFYDNAEDIKEEAVNTFIKMAFDKVTQGGTKALDENQLTPKIIKELERIKKLVNPGHEVKTYGGSTVKVSTNRSKVSPRNREVSKNAHSAKRAVQFIGNAPQDLEWSSSYSANDQKKIISKLVDGASVTDDLDLHPDLNVSKPLNLLSSPYLESGELNPLFKDFGSDPITLSNGKQVTFFDIDKIPEEKWNSLSYKEKRALTRISSPEGRANQIMGSLLGDFSLASTFMGVKQWKAGQTTIEQISSDFNTLRTVIPGGDLSKFDNILRHYQKTVQEALKRTPDYEGKPTRVGSTVVRDVQFLKQLQVLVNHSLLQDNVKLINHGDGFAFSMKNVSYLRNPIRILKDKRGMPLILTHDDLFDIYNVQNKVPVYRGEKEIPEQPVEVKGFWDTFKAFSPSTVGFPSSSAK